MSKYVHTEKDISWLKGWLVWHHILHVNHWWGFRFRGWYYYWQNGLVITKNFPHTEN